MIMIKSMLTRRVSATASHSGDYKLNAKGQSRLSYFVSFLSSEPSSLNRNTVIFLIGNLYSFVALMLTAVEWLQVVVEWKRIRWRCQHPAAFVQNMASWYPALQQVMLYKHTPLSFVKILNRHTHSLYNIHERIQMFTLLHKQFYTYMHTCI